MKQKITLWGSVILACLLFVNILLLSGCTQPTQPFVILHAGGGASELRYLNAQETFEQYYDLGYRYFEYDFQLSDDGRLIGTHAWEHLPIYYPSTITYDEFIQAKLSNGYTPANEDWLVDTIKNFPDVKIIIDAKMNTTEEDVLVLQRIEQLETIHNIDMSANIIPEIFSKEMWDIAKETTTFDQYIFSHYKVYYSVSQIIEYFSDDRIWAVGLPTYCDYSFRSQIYRLKNLGKKILVFTPTTKDEVASSIQLGADALYLDYPSLLDE